jgi:glycosyltransferase involved in cell wall biosynthesis
MTANLVFGDAVTNDVLELDRRLKAWGFDARIYASSIEPRLGDVGQPDAAYEPFLAERDDLLIYHYSIYNANLHLYKRTAGRKLVIYHNITPAEYFHGFDAHLESLCRLGRLALPELRDCDLALAVSEFNRRELVAAGIPEERTAVLPLLLNLAALNAAAPSAAVERKVQAAGRPGFLYVGRVAPNKRCEDLIKLLHVYRHSLAADAHLWLVGSRSLPGYTRFLEALIDRLDLKGAVTFADRVTLGELRTYYECCDVFVYASRHEGFGVPLLESMHFGLPILAYRAAAVPETLGSAGVMFSAWEYEAVAEMLHQMVSDTDLRRRVAAGQRRRLAEFTPERVEAGFRQALARVGAL